MVSIEETVGLTVGSITMAPGAYSQFEQGVASASAGGVERGLGRSEKVNTAIGKMFEVGFQRVGRSIKETADEIDRQNIKTQQTISALQEKLRNENDAAKRQEIAREIRANKQMNEKKQEALNLRLKHEMQAAERHVELLERADERSQKSWYKTSAEVGEKLGAGVENISGVFTSGGIDPSALTQGLAEGIGGLGDMLAGKLAQAGMGEAAAALGTAAAAIAGAAAALGAVVAIFSAVVDQTVELNKSITEAIAPIDLMSGRTGKLKDTLKDLRVEFTNVAMATGLAAADLIQASSALSDAGFSMKEFGRITGMAGNEIRAMVGVSEQAVVASKSLGIEVSDFGAFLKNVTSMGGILEDVTGSFGLISAGAEKAGMRTKDFFTAINEASTGMSLYNFKVSDTVGLFTSLTKVLGEDLAKERLGLEKAYGGMGIQDRYKDVMVRGAGKTQGILEVGAEKQADMFADKFAGVITGGLESIGGTSALDIEKLGAMNEKQFVQLLAGITATTEKDADLAKQQLQTLYNISKSTRGGTMAQASAMGSTDKLTELSLQLSSASTFFGDKSLGEIAETMVGRSFLEENLGMSGELLEQNIRLDRRFRSEYAKLAENAKAEGKEIGTYEQELAKGSLTTQEDLKEIAQRNLSTAEKLGYETLDATTSIADDIKNIIASLLESIASGVDTIISGLRSFLKDDDEKRKQEEIANLRQALIVQQGQVLTQRETVRGKRDELKNAKGDASKTATLKAELEEAEEKLKELTATKSGLMAEISAVSAGGTLVESARAREQAMAVASGGEVARTTKQSKGTWGTLNNSGDFITQVQQPTKIKEAASIVSGADARTLGDFSTQLQGLNLDPYQAQTQLSKSKTLTEKMYDDGTLKEGWQGIKVSSEEMTTILNEILTNSTLTEEENESLRNLAKIQTSSEGSENAAEGSEKSLKELLKLAQQEDKANLSAVTGKSLAQLESMGEAQIKAAIDASAASAEQKARARLTAGVEDFIYRGDGISGTITPIDKKDDFFGAKPGGAIDKAVNGGGIVINISGVGNAEEVARAVASTLKRMGYGNAKMYKN